MMLPLLSVYPTLLCMFRTDTDRLPFVLPYSFVRLLKMVRCFLIP